MQRAAVAKGDVCAVIVNCVCVARTKLDLQNCTCTSNVNLSHADTIGILARSSLLGLLLESLKWQVDTSQRCC